MLISFDVAGCFIHQRLSVEAMEPRYGFIQSSLWIGCVIKVGCSVSGATFDWLLNCEFLFGLLNVRNVSATISLSSQQQFIGHTIRSKRI